MAEKKSNGSTKDKKLQYPPTIYWCPLTLIGSENSKAARIRTSIYADYEQEHRELLPARSNLMVHTVVKFATGIIAMKEGRPMKELAPIYLFEGLHRMGEVYERRIRNYRASLQALLDSRMDEEDKAEFTRRPELFGNISLVRWGIETFTGDFDVCNKVAGILNCLPATIRNVGWMSRLVEHPDTPHTARLKMKDYLKEWSGWFRRREMRLDKALERAKNEDVPFHPALPTFSLKEIEGDSDVHD